MKLRFGSCPLIDAEVFEKVYPEGLQLDLVEKAELFEDAIAVYLYVDDGLAGETYGVPLGKLGEDVEGCEDIQHKEEVVYCYSNTILPDYQKCGLGSILKAYWLGTVKAMGYKRVVGHARPGGSQALNAKFDAILLGTFKDWYGTGEDYRMYTLTL